MNGNRVQGVCPLPSAQYVCLQKHFMFSDPGSVCATTPCLCDLVCVYIWGLKAPAGLGLSVTASVCRTLSQYECQGVTCSGCPCLSVCIRLCVVPYGLVNHFCV